MRVFTKNMNYLYSLAQIQDDDILFKKFEEMSLQEKEKLEDSIIGLYSLDSKESSVFKTFIDRYTKYVTQKSNNDVMFFLNNRFLNYLYSAELLKKNENKAYNGSVLGRNIDDIYDDIDNKYFELNEKLDKKIKFTEEEISFMKKLYINCAQFESIFVDADLSEENDYDIINFCNQYPLDIENSIDDQQVFLIYNIIKSLINIKGKYHIIFNQFESEKNFKNLGSVSNFKGRDDEYLISIYYTDQIFFDSMKNIADVLFTIFHEIGHILQSNCKEKYDSDMLDIFEDEYFILENDRDFYDKYHDNFLIEQDANLYAFNIMTKLFNDSYPEFCDYALKKMKSKNLIDSKLFTKLFYEKYEQLLNEKNNNSVIK